MKTSMHVCDGCGKHARLGPLPRKARNHYCTCNPDAPFYMTPLKIKKESARLVKSLLAASQMRR